MVEEFAICGKDDAMVFVCCFLAINRGFSTGYCDCSSLSFSDCFSNSEFSVPRLISLETRTRDAHQ